MKKTLFILTFLVGAITFAASAQTAADRATIRNTIGVGPRLGYYKAQDADAGNYYGGLQARLKLGAIVGVEGSVEYRAGQEYGFSDYTVTTSFVPVTASLLIFAPLSESLAPYGVAGLGAYYTNYSYSEAAEALGFKDSSEFNLGYHLGFGLEIPLSRNVALNADYRYLFLNPGNNDESLMDADFNGNVITAGLMFYF